MENLNNHIFYSLNKFAGLTDWQDKIIVFFAKDLAYVLVALFLIGVLLIKIDNEHKIKAIISLTLNAIIGRFFLVEIIRYFYHHERPFAVLPYVHKLLSENSYSFPSGHATFFFGLSAIVYTINKKIGCVFFILSSIMGLARIASGVHFPLDILSGAIIGTVVGLLCVRITDLIWKKIKY